VCQNTGVTANDSHLGQLGRTVANKFLPETLIALQICWFWRVFIL